MLICDGVSILLLASIPIAFWLEVLTIWHLIFVSLAVGVVGVFFLNAYQVFLPSIVQRDRLEAANVRVQGSEAAARIAGPGLGGWLAQAFGGVTGILVDVVSFAVSALCLLQIKFTEPPNSKAVRGAGIGQEIREGIQYVIRNPYLRLIAVYAAACNFAEGLLGAVVIVFAVRTVGADAGIVGTLIAVAGIGGVLGALASGTIIRVMGNARTLVWAGAGTAPFALLIPLASKGPGLTLFVIGLLVPNIGLIVSNVVIDSFRQSYCQRTILGRVVSSTRCLTYGTGALGTLAGGLIAEQFGARTGTWTAVIAQVLCAVIVLTGPIRNRRDLPARSDV
jgi:predicted MFS family arabinose efflux permease